MKKDSKEYAEYQRKVQQERWKRYYEEYPVSPQGIQRCRRCNEVKRYNVEDLSDSEFGRVRCASKAYPDLWLPNSLCRQCKNEEYEGYRQKIKASDPKKWKERKRRYDANWRKRMGEKAYLEWKRENSAQYRRRQGVPVRNWKETPKNRQEKRVQVPVDPFREWILERWPDGGAGREIRLRLGYDAEKIRKILNKVYSTTDVDFVDEVLTEFNGPHLSELYPHLYSF